MQANRAVFRSTFVDAKHNIRLTVEYSLIGLTLLCCDEQLPPTGNPQNLFTATSSAVYPGAPRWNDPPYVRNSYLITVKLKNNYDETLSGYGEFGGHLEIVWEGNPKYRKTVALDKKTLLTNGSRFYNPTTNTVTLDPGDELIFNYEWDWTTDSGDTLTKIFNLKRDETCINYIVNSRGRAIGFVRPRWSSKEVFIVNAQVKLFREFASVQTPRLRQIVEYENFPNSQCIRIGGSSSH